jgi:ubiquinone/menaquinone biosynthesis C-methylase UbiE
MDEANRDRLVVRVNEVYHDVEKGEYEYKHPEIFAEERARWRRVAERFIASSQPLRVLDVGSGTGFVPLQIAEFLKEGDLLVCGDVSEQMVEVCRSNLARRDRACTCEFVKLDGRTLPWDAGAFDRVTMNSVAHHVPDLAGFFGQADRVLAAGGLLVIGHEPNRPFYVHPFLWPNYRLVSAICNPRRVVGDALRMTRLMRLVRRLFGRFSRGISDYEKILRAVNDRLLGEGTISRPLTADEMTELVDVHSPTAGGYHADRGLDLFDLRGRYLSGFEVEHFETYDHLFDTTARNRFTRHYGALLRRRFPQSGSLFLAVLRKA